MFHRRLVQLKCRDIIYNKFLSSVSSKQHRSFLGKSDRCFSYSPFCWHELTPGLPKSPVPLASKLPFDSRRTFCHQEKENDNNSALGDTESENTAAFQRENNAATTHNAAPEHRTTQNFCFSTTATPETEDEILSSFSLYLDFVTPAEELQLLQEADRHLQRLRYLFSHWDDAIEGYRETEVSRWSSGSSAVLSRLRARAFGGARGVLVHTHVLDLAAEGYIKPHVDSVRFCGSTIAGMSLGSEAVMRLAKETRGDQSVDVLLPARSVYVMRDAARYLYTHEVLRTAQFRGRSVAKGRRVSVICRNHPPAQRDQT